MSTCLAAWPPPTFLSLAEATRVSSLSESTLDRLIRAGRVEAFRVGRRVLLSADSLDRMVRSGRVAS